MATLKKVLLTEVEYYDPGSSTWKVVNAVSLENPEQAVPLAKAGAQKAILYKPGTPVTMPSEITQAINWTNFLIEGSLDTGFNIFGASLGRIPTTIKSPLIRYYIETTATTTEDVVTTNTQLHYMMLNAAFSADPFNGAGGTATATDSTTLTNIKFYFPGVTQTVTNSLVASAQATLLSTVNNWKIYVRRPDGTERVSVPNSATPGTPSTTTATDYGVAKILMSLVASITYPTNGTYEITVEFTSNDQDPAFSIPSRQLVTATVTVYMGSSQQYVVSRDSDVAMTVSFAG